MKIVSCSFCLLPYDMELMPKPLVVETKGPWGQVRICASCVKAATAMMKPDMGPNWPRKKGER